jgi:hypothetical protein
MSGALTMLLIACSHQDAFTPDPSTVGPPGTTADVRITTNPEQDYWPTWSEDGQGILYSFVEPGHLQHRCLGLLPPQGGTRIWEFCDKRVVEADTTTSYTAYALGADGRLLYVEAAAPTNATGTPTRRTLWLADSATPTVRTGLLALPLFIGPRRVAWLSDLAWTGPATFIALAQDFSIAGAPFGCPVKADSVFADSGAVVVGTISNGHATIDIVPGTTGATAYSLAESGASIVFTMRDDLRLFKVPRAGGVATSVATVTTTAGSRLAGVSCKVATCLVAADPLLLDIAGIGGCSGVKAGPKELRSVSIADGSAQVILTAADIITTPQVSPVSTDVIAQVGGNPGHLQTFKSASGGDLHLYHGVIQ